MLSAQHTRTEVQPAAGHALPHTLYAEGRLGKPNFIHHYQSQPSSTMFKRAEDNESVVPKVRFGQTTTVINDLVILIGGLESTEGVFPSNLLVLNLNSSSLNLKEQNTKLPVLGHGAAPIRGSKVLITFGIQTKSPQRTFATPIREIDINTMNILNPNITGVAPQQRQDHTTTKSDDNKIFIYGGKNKDEVILGDIFYIDLNLNSWNYIEQPSYPIACHSSILINSYLISCFGIDANAKVISDCRIFNIFTNTFIQSISEDPPIPRKLSSMVSFESNKNDVYIFGGIDENGNGLNDLYKLDVSKVPKLSWSPIYVNVKTTNNNLIPPGRGAHSAFALENHIMTIWGGIFRENQLADPNFYFFDINSERWINDDEINPQIGLPVNIKNSDSNNSPVRVIIILGIIVIVLVLGFVALFIIRKQKMFQKFRNKEISNDPYSADQSGKLGSDTYLINDFETKQVQLKVIDEPELVPEPTPQPASTLILSPTKDEKEVESSNSVQINDSSITPTTPPKRIPFGKLPTLTNTGSISETQRMKRTHRRTSSVSLTSSELSNIALSRNFTHHKSSLSTSSSPLNNSHQNFRKSSSIILDPVSEKGTKFNNRNSDKSVNSVQWIGFSNSMIYDQEENRDALHVRNLSSKQQKNSRYHKSRYSSDAENDGYIINGDYIDTSYEVKNHNDNIFDHNEAMTTTHYPTKNNNIKQGDIYTAHNKTTSRGSGNIEKFANESPQNSHEFSEIYCTNNEEDKGSSMKKSKRSSKRISRVSFALKDEKVEFNENESSNTVSLTRMSGRSLSSQSSIIEEEDSKHLEGF